MTIAKYATCGHGSLGIEPSDVTCTYKFNIYVIACEQALRGALVVGWEKEGQHATWLSASKKLMWDAEFAEMTLVMMSLPLTRVFECLFTFVLVSASHWLAENLTAQSKGHHLASGGGIQIPEKQLQPLLPFPALQPEHPGELAHRLLCYSQAIISIIKTCHVILHKKCLFCLVTNITVNFHVWTALVLFKQLTSPKQWRRCCIAFLLSPGSLGMKLDLLL